MTSFATNEPGISEWTLWLGIWFGANQDLHLDPSANSDLNLDRHLLTALK
jgi:hypothetical protein